MATTSHPWKQLLLRQAETLHELSQPHRWGESSAIRTEETVVLGFYAIRRLINGFLLSESLVHRTIAMQSFPAQRKTGLLRGEGSFEQLYDLKAGRPTAHDLLFLCHQVLHNCVFAVYFGDDRALQGVYLTSDHQRKVALYGIERQVIQDLFTKIGEER